MFRGTKSVREAGLGFKPRSSRKQLRRTQYSEGRSGHRRVEDAVRKERALDTCFALCESAQGHL